MAKRSSRRKTASSQSARPSTGDEDTRPATAATPGTGDWGGGDQTASKPDADSISALAHMHIWQIQAVRDVLVVAAVIAVFWAGYALRAVTVPLLVALLLAYLFEPLIRRMSRHPKISRAGAVLTLLVSVGGIFVVALALSLPLVVGQSIQFIDDIREGVMRQRVARLERWVPAAMRDEFDSLVERLPAGSLAARDQSVALEPQEEPPAEIAPGAEQEAAGPPPGDTPAAGADDQAGEPRLDEIIDARVAERLEPLRRELALLQQRLEAPPPAAEKDTADAWVLAKRGLRTVANIVGSLIGLGLLAFLIPFYFFFFSLWYPEVVHFGDTLLPKKNRQRTLELLAKMDRVVAGFVRGRIVISIIMGILLAAGWLVCGVPYAIPLGLIVGVFCAIPYLGAIGIPAAVGLLFFEQLGLPPEQRTIWLGWLGVVLWPTLWFAIVQAIEGYALTPMIAGKATKLDPVTIVVVVLAGGSVMGVYGMLLAIPVAACGKILFMDVLLPRIRAWTRGEVEDPLPIERE
jgi:predicted PurR-regulated permease PerM